jgi:hypothetical protein
VRRGAAAPEDGAPAAKEDTDRKVDTDLDAATDSDSDADADAPGGKMPPPEVGPD